MSWIELQMHSRQACRCKTVAWMYYFFFLLVMLYVESHFIRKHNWHWNIYFYFFSLSLRNSRDCYTERIFMLSVGLWRRLSWCFVSLAKFVSIATSCFVVSTSFNSIHRWNRRKYHLSLSLSSSMLFVIFIRLAALYTWPVPICCHPTFVDLVVSLFFVVVSYFLYSRIRSKLIFIVGAFFLSL